MKMSNEVYMNSNKKNQLKSSEMNRAKNMAEPKKNLQASPASEKKKETRLDLHSIYKKYLKAH
jgi:hypothetical protein